MRRVLLLNITYEPLTTVGLHRAVCLVLGEKADVLHADADGIQLHSASIRLPGALGDQAAPLRPGTASQPRPADQGRADAPGQLPVRLLRDQGRHH